ncbi:MAG: hypothetical protein AMJ54_17190 [Deltaproteobacteria bacterium SG8_13]|nr:MAG: hypothetical protein AMJ54_17190 [Deltaproteobacteria bacterium SG8_13]
MKPKSIIVAALLLSVGLATGVGASLIGDEVTVQYIQNDQVLDQQTFIIEEGNDDAIRTGFNTISLNIEAEGVYIDFIGSNSYPAGFSTFFGIKILGLDDVDNPDWILLGADVTENTMTNYPLWYAEEDSRLLVDPINGDVGFDWHQMSYRPGQSFAALLEFGPNPIPIPATMALFVTGLIGFIIMRRKKKG